MGNVILTICFQKL